MKYIYTVDIFLLTYELKFLNIIFYFFQAPCLIILTSSILFQLLLKLSKIIPKRQKTPNESMLSKCGRIKDIYSNIWRKYRIKQSALFYNVSEYLTLECLNFY